MFEDQGCETDLQFAANDIPNQQNQIENMIIKGADLLVNAAIDGLTFSDIVQNAHDAGVLAIACNRLISRPPMLTTTRPSITSAWRSSRTPGFPKAWA